MNEMDIGRNIRALRVQSKLTLEFVANRAKITRGALSKIETGKISSPISTLMRIADVLEVPLSTFFLEDKKNPRFVLTRKDGGQQIHRNGSQWGYSYESLASGMRNKVCEPFLLTIKPGDPIGEFQHGGQEFIYVLSGSLKFTVGAEDLLLRVGDSLYFDPTEIHKTEVVGNKPARFLCIFISPHRDEILSIESNKTSDQKKGKWNHEK